MTGRIIRLFFGEEIYCEVWKGEVDRDEFVISRDWSSAVLVVVLFIHFVIGTQSTSQ
jgi:hypothetical protein